jgi:hypothetical protein
MTSPRAAGDIPSAAKTRQHVRKRQIIGGFILSRGWLEYLSGQQLSGLLITGAYLPAQGLRLGGIGGESAPHIPLE